MRQAFERQLDQPRTVWLAAGISLALGLFFVFVWAPHPWGWRGIDQYHELARALARGEPFGTTDVPWGYAYFVAANYFLFGERTWIPVTIQALVNATTPVLLFHLARPFVGRRTAALSALLVGVFSFNTIYASTQASDSICTVLFLASLLLFLRGHRHGSILAFAAAGFLSGVVPQFRPNLIILPFVLAAGYLVITSRSRRQFVRMAAYLALVGVALTPWVIRNYRLTGTVLPTSTHGGVQLWYGTLQVGPYLESRARNPRSVFESPDFDYTSLADTPIVVRADVRTCAPWDQAAVSLVYWTDRDPAPVVVPPSDRHGVTLRFDLPGQPDPTAIYYTFDTTWPASVGGPPHQPTPLAGRRAPLVFFVSADHLGNLDRHDDLLDVFDIAGLVRRIAWPDAPAPTPRLDLNGDGATNQADLEIAIARLMPTGAVPEQGPVVSAVGIQDAAAVLRLVDGSTLTVPRTFRKVTDLAFEGNLAGALESAYHSFASIETRTAPPADPCRVLEHVRVNDVFERRDVHQMRRYTALAFDNIRRTPGAFLAASAYRLVRLFIIRGSDDAWTTYQFSGSGLVYGAGLVLSSAYFLVFLAGVVIAWRRRSRVLVFLVPIAYVPATICFVLTNMRYTITVQPLMFVFVAIALAAAAGVRPSPEGDERSGAIGG